MLRAKSWFFALIKCACANFHTSDRSQILYDSLYYKLDRMQFLPRDAMHKGGRIRFVNDSAEKNSGHSCSGQMFDIELKNVDVNSIYTIGLETVSMSGPMYHTVT